MAKKRPTKKTKDAPSKGVWTAEVVGKELPNPAKEKYDATAKRLIAAVAELNDALKEAHGNNEMRVEIWRDNPEDLPANYRYRIYRLTHSEMTFKVRALIPDKQSVGSWWDDGEYQFVDKPTGAGVA